MFFCLKKEKWRGADSEGWVVLCLKGQELWPCETAGEVSSRVSSCLALGDPCMWWLSVRRTAWNDLLVLRGKACEGYKRPWKESYRVIISNQSFQLEVCPLLVLPPVTSIKHSRTVCSQMPNSQAGQHLLVRGDFPSTESSLECLRTLCFIIALWLKNRIECGVCWGRRVLGVFWGRHVSFSYLLMSLLRNVYLYCPGNHWAFLFSKNHLKLDVTEF